MHDILYSWPIKYGINYQLPCLIYNSSISVLIQGGPTPTLVKAEVPWSARRGSLSEKDRVLKTVKG